ncbi:MAG TPA: dihydrolipoamide acetyltransferase family protein [Solirubrobacteraceae bacterium]|nr:dihydrolipoamide acetyltransferase family protein [Solirubrobacteraceae bacterium]
MTDVVMPRLSDTMEEGTVLRWLKRDGEHVRRGEELVEIETDKAAMIYESDREGVLETIAREGDTLAVGEPIARIGETGGGDAADVAERAGIETFGQADGAETIEQIGASAEQTGAGAAEQQVTTAVAASSVPHNGSPATQSTQGRGKRVKASPLARRIARETGVDLTALTGSGPGGRIVKADVEASARPRLAPSPAQPDVTVSAPATPAPTVPPTPPPVEGVAGAKGATTAVELSRTQRTIARRMAESRATIPDFTLQVNVDMERCVELRAELKRLSHVDAPTYNDMIVKACALALREHPRANGSYRDGRFELHSRVNVGVAVAVASGDPTQGALVVPTVLDADAKSLGEIARETRTLAQRVRDATVTPPELSGATFTVSNLGMYGIASFTAIINPPQAAILAVGAVEPRAVVRFAGADNEASVGEGSADSDGQIVTRHTMSLTLACDHRILYGADAAMFLARIRELLEEPAALTL